MKKILLAGPCVIESRDMIMKIAEKFKSIINHDFYDFYFKASFDKANRTSIDSFRGPGIDEGLKILEEVKKEFGYKIVTDIHESTQANQAGEICDILQIPAFLCRQTDLLVAAANTGKIVNIKKAQFLSGNDMKNVVKKVEESGNTNILLTERGNMMGYNNLVVDFRNIQDMKSFGYPVIMDATHSVQRPGGNGTTTGGNSEFAHMMAKSAIMWGATGLFFETHPDPSKALSDGPNMIPLLDFKNVLEDLEKTFELQNNFKVSNYE